MAFADNSGLTVYIDNYEENVKSSGSRLDKCKSVKWKVEDHEYVDLGLPSGLKWATMNVGASKPEDPGYYFAWGETSTKSDYSSGTSSTGGMTKEALAQNGVINEDGNLTAKYDVATRRWGDSWRMPTGDDFYELLENCTWVWTSINGIGGYEVYSKVNTNSIFLPAGGNYYDVLYEVGSSGYYWSSTIVDTNRFNAYRLIFDYREHYVDSNSRDYGRCVRPVTE